MTLPKTVKRGEGTHTFDWPRRSCIDQLTPAELAIRQAVDAVEAVGADPRLTDAVTLLQQAREKVADCLEDPTFQAVS